LKLEDKHQFFKYWDCFLSQISYWFEEITVILVEHSVLSKVNILKEILGKYD